MKSRIVATAVLTAAIGTATVAAAAPASAVSYRFVGSTTVPVTEASSGIQVAGLPFKAYDQARISCSGKIWAGVWFTGENGPDGWADSAPSHFPHPGSAGGRSFSAIARFTFPGGDPVQSWRHNGSFGVHSAPGADGLVIELRTNDDRPGGGSGQFTCTVSRYERIS